MNSPKRVHISKLLWTLNILKPRKMIEKHFDKIWCGILKKQQQNFGYTLWNLAILYYIVCPVIGAATSKFILLSTSRYLGHELIFIIHNQYYIIRYNMIGYETAPYKPPVTYMHNSVSDYSLYRWLFYIHFEILDFFATIGSISIFLVPGIISCNRKKIK